MEEDDIFESDELSIDEATSSYADDIPDNEVYSDPTVGNIVNFVQERYGKAEKARYSDEQRWIKAYQNYRGIYGPDVQFTSTEKSRVFVKVTKTKVLAAYGQIVDVLFGNHKFPISINPTRLPDGVAESVHFEASPEIKKATSTAPIMNPEDTKLQPGETIIDLRERLAGMKDRLEPVIDDLKEGPGLTLTAYIPSCYGCSKENGKEDP